MLFNCSFEYIGEYNQAIIEFSSKYTELIDYSIANFDKIVSSTEPEVTHYNNGFKNCEILRQKCNEAYIKKMDAFKQRYGEAELNRVRKQLME